MRTARMWMASATPGGAPGYDENKEASNNITHSAAQTSQRLRGTYWPNPGSQGKAGAKRMICRLARLAALGERKCAATQPVAWMKPRSCPDPEHACIRNQRNRQLTIRGPGCQTGIGHGDLRVTAAALFIQRAICPRAPGR